MTGEDSGSHARPFEENFIPFETDPVERMIQLNGTLFLYNIEDDGLPAERRHELQQMFDEFQEAVTVVWNLWHEKDWVGKPFPERMSRETFAARFLLRSGALNPEDYGEARW